MKHKLTRETKYWDKTARNRLFSYALRTHRIRFVVWKIQFRIAMEIQRYSRTRIKETRIKETFGYEKRFHSSDFMQVKLSTLIGQLIKETMDKKSFSLRPMSFFYLSLTVF